MGALHRFMGITAGTFAIFATMKSLDSFLYGLDEK